MSDAIANAAPRTSSKSAWPLALGGLGLTFVAGFSFLFLLDIPFIRSTAMPNFALMVLGVLLAAAALTRRPFWLAAVATALSAAMTGMFGYGIYIAKLPEATPASLAASAPAGFAFELIDTENKPVRLAELQGRGPLLLVFYRGFW